MRICLCAGHRERGCVNGGVCVNGRGVCMCGGKLDRKLKIPNPISINSQEAANGGVVLLKATNRAPGSAAGSQHNHRWR